MAHFTKEFRRLLVFPLVIFVLFLLHLIVVLSIYTYWAVIFAIIPVAALLFIITREICIKRYKDIKLRPGSFKYFPGKSPSYWHKKMGYLRLLEILTPQEFKADLYRKCGANIGNNVVLAGKILEPDLTAIGSDTIIGVDTLITAHEIIIQKGRIMIRFNPISIGEKCIIGAKSIILPGATIPSGTMIPAYSVIKKDENIYISSKSGDKQ